MFQILNLRFKFLISKIRICLEFRISNLRFYILIIIYDLVHYPDRAVFHFFKNSAKILGNNRKRNQLNCAQKKHGNQKRQETGWRFEKKRKTELK